MKSMKPMENSINETFLLSFYREKIDPFRSFHSRQCFKLWFFSFFLNSESWKNIFRKFLYASFFVDFLRDRLQISLLVISESKQINQLFLPCEIIRKPVVF